MKTVFLNATKLDFDQKLDFSSVQALTELTNYDDTSNEQILERVQGQTVVITKEMTVGKDVISRFPDSVKLICEAGTGYNNIDIVNNCYTTKPYDTFKIFDTNFKKNASDLVYYSSRDEIILNFIIGKINELDISKLDEQPDLIDLKMEIVKI